MRCFDIAGFGAGPRIESSGSCLGHLGAIGPDQPRRPGLGFQMCDCVKASGSSFPHGLTKLLIRPESKSASATHVRKFGTERYRFSSRGLHLLLTRGNARSFLELSETEANCSTMVNADQCPEKMLMHAALQV